MKPKEFQLNPLKSGQHLVASLPKTTTDFPFFYLTKQKERLAEPIVFEGVDSEGHPIRWAATPNAAIGSPGIDAHEVWTRLVKPTWEAYRTSENRLPNVLPLGGIRQCLRVVGWGQGGWEARRLLRALNQIGATWCTADFLVPTAKTGEDGKPMYKPIKGSFSRLTIFAIGDKHLTEEELQEGKFSFDFDLEDTLYIQFHQLEVALQESQPQRYLDNQYMFSVRPSGRRWYELMAAKIFGVVKNRGEYCEIRYSWYVKHHHTLTRQTQHKRIVQQMNDVAHDHVASGFIERIEYRKIQEIGQPTDFLIRYFPGIAAKQSIARVGSAINDKRLPPAGAPRVYKRKQKDTTAAATLNDEDRSLSPVSEPVSSTSAPQSAEESELPEEVQGLIGELTERGIFRTQAVKLIKALPSEHLSRVEDYIDYWDTLRKSKTISPGLLVELVRNADPLPAWFVTRTMKEERRRKTQREHDLAQVEKALAERHETQCRELVNRYIERDLPEGEFERRLRAHTEAILQEPGFWGERPDRAEQLARIEVRAEIKKTLDLPTKEAFRKAELPRVLVDLKLTAEELGLDLPSQDMPQNATEGPPQLVAPEDGETPTSEQNSSPASS